MKRKKWWNGGWHLLWLFLLTTCNRPPELPEQSPVVLIQSAADRMNGLAGFHFDISREGAPAYLDPDEILSFRRATGAYVSPDAAAASVRVIGPGLITDVDVISIGETQWQTNVATSQWEELPPNWGFNPAVLFDEKAGLPAILLEDVSDLQAAAAQNLADSGGPDQLLYHLTGTVTGDRLYAMSGTLIGPQPVAVEMWITPETFDLVRVVVKEPVPGTEEGSVWQIDFTDFGEVMEIKAPE